MPPVNVARRSQLFEIWIRPIALTEPGTLHDRTLFATKAAVRELHGLLAARVGEQLGERQTELRPWVLTPHKPNYFLPISYNPDPYAAPYIDASGDPNLALLAAENLAWYGFLPVTISYSTMPKA